MKKRRFERVAVMMLSIAMLLSSTGIISSLAANAGESSVASSKFSWNTVSSTTVAQEGGAVVSTSVAQEGGSLVVDEDGDGTVQNPYRISNAAQFLNMNNLINLTTSSNKHFVLTADIDLSGVTEADFIRRGSGLVTVNKAAAKSSSNVFFILDGNGHKITGLNVKANSAAIISVFGFLNERSEIRNLTIEKPVITSRGTSLIYASLVAFENNGTIKNVTVNYPVMTLESCTYAGFIASINNGTIADVTVRGLYSSASAAAADSHTVSASGTVGAIAGTNSGVITSASVINVGMYIPEKAKTKTICGAVAGVSDGTVNNSVATGTICGGSASDIAGGIIGKAGASARLSDNYTLVSVSQNVIGCGVIGASGTAEMIKDCYWSSTVSKKSSPITDACGGVNDISTNGFKVIRVGDNVNIGASDFGAFKWGKAVFALDGELKASGDGLSVAADGGSVNVRGVKADSVGKVTYLAKVTLPATVGAGSGSVTVTQYMKIFVFTVPQDAVGNGTAGEPLVINNSAEISFLAYSQNMNVKLGKDIYVGGPLGRFNGFLDGDGHKLIAVGQIFSSVTGTVKNLNVTVSENISRSIFGNIYGASMNNIMVSFKDGVKLVADNGNIGIFADKIADASEINNCRVKGNIVLTSDALYNVGGFAGVVCGKGTKLSNSGAAVDISEKSGKRTASTANFIGDVSADGVEISNCYAAGANTAGRFTFIGCVSAKSVALKNNYIEISENESAAKKALDFDSYRAFANENMFRTWTFDDKSGFFTSTGKDFSATLPEIEAVKNSASGDFGLVYDASKISASVKVDGGKLILTVSRLKGVVTVKALPVKVVSNATGLSATIYVSNGLEKDAEGIWVISTAYDLAYIGENIESLADASFVMNSDIDMSSVTEYTPIGSASTAFGGKLDGRGHTISNLKINGSAKTALFGTVADAEIKNIKFAKADIVSAGGYAAVLAGQATGKTVISNIVVTDSAISVNDNFASLIVASVDNSNGVKISDITVKNSSIKSSANYVGAVVGRAAENTAVSDIKIDKFTVSGSNYISGAVGLAQGDSSVAIGNVSVSASNISGVSEISGIASCSGKGVSVKDAAVDGSKIFTVGSGSAFTAAGIAAVSGSTIENASVTSTSISAGIAAGVVAKVGNGGALSVKNVSVKSSQISASGANTVVAGILGMHNVDGTAEIIGGRLESDVAVGGASVTAGLVGDFSAAGGSLKIKGTKSFASVKGGEVDAIATSGVVGRVGPSAVNGMTIDGVKIGGSVSGSGVLGGAIGLIKSGEPYNGKQAVITDSVIYPQMTDTGLNSRAGMLIASLESNKTIDSKQLDKAVINTVISAYYGSVSAYSADSALEGGGYKDMDKPNGNAITTSVPVLSTATQTEVKIINLPNISGYQFDKNTGWVSESDERIQVVSSTENTAVLKANHKADISIVGYYVLASDEEIRVPVHFKAVSDMRTPLKGSGTESDPYLVSCAYDLETVAQYESENAYFVLTNDINFTPADFEFGGAFYNVGNGVVTIGTAEKGFKGNFDGKGHSINGLVISGNTFGALFGAADGAVISNIVINNADITGLNYAAVLIGSARNTTVKNITINSSKVQATEFGGYAASVVGYAENTVIDKVTVKDVNISTSSEATNATVEVAGGVAGVFDGTIKNVKTSGVKISSASVAGGLVGAISDVDVAISVVDINSDVRAKLSGGLIGKVENPLKLSINSCVVGGKVTGTDVSAGVIGKVTAKSSSYSLDKAKSPLISDTIVTAVIAQSDVCGAIIGDASVRVFCNSQNLMTNVFDKVYYSSYQNSMGAFGEEEINSYQNSEYTVFDLNNIKYIDGETERTSIPLTNQYMPISSDALKLEGISDYRTFTVGGKKFDLTTIRSGVDGALSYDAKTSALKLNVAEPTDVKAILVYNDGLEAAVDVAMASDLLGSGTQSDPYLISNAEEFAIMLERAAVSGVCYKLTADIKLSGIGSAETFAGELDGDGHVLYDHSGAGLFGRVTGTVKNTGFVGFRASSDSAVALGAVVGVVDGGVIDNCVAIAEVSASGKNQDAGVLAGRAVNGALVKNVVTSGKVIGENALAVGGVIGSVSNSKLSNATSTAYVKGGKTVGGIVGDVQNSELANVIFGNMVETSGGKAGNIVGISDGKRSSVSNAYYDSKTSRVSAASGNGDINAKALSTQELASLKTDGFNAVGGYPVPASVAAVKNSTFAVATGFASMKVNYFAGLNAGDAYSYTTVTVDEDISGNKVTVKTNDGLVITLVPTVDYTDAENAIARYSNPASSSGATVSCNIVDATGGRLGDKLIGVLLKAKMGDDSNAFNFFTKASDDVRAIAPVVITDGGLYVDAVLPDGATCKVSAVDENGKSLNVKDAKNEGSLIETGAAKAVVITITAEDDTADSWGLHSVWGVIGK